MQRIEHNLTLAKNWFAARGIRMGIPPISEQLPTTPINRRALFPYGYNPSIIRWRGRILMAYRYHPNGNGASKLAMAELDDQFRVTSNLAVDISVGSIEDPRLFTYGDNLCVSYVVSTMPSHNPTCVIRWGVLKENGKTWSVDGQWLVQHGKNDGTAMEKNWVFYEDRGLLKCIYQASPTQDVLTVDQERATSASSIPQTHRWKWGGFKGGTGPLTLSDGRKFRFFHSRLDNEPRPEFWRYYVGAMLIDESGNGATTSVSKKPILIGSEHDDMSKTESASCVHYKPKVVFPLGAIEHEGGWMLSVGINDSACALAHVKEESLNL